MIRQESAFSSRDREAEREKERQRERQRERQKKGTFPGPRGDKDDKAGISLLK